MDIEKLMRENFREAEETPPEGVWDQIANQLHSAPAASTPAKGGLLKSAAAKVMAGVVAACAVAGLTTVLLTSRPTDKPATKMDTNPQTSELAAVTSSTNVAESTPAPQQAPITKTTTQNHTHIVSSVVAPTNPIATTSTPTTPNRNVSSVAEPAQKCAPATCPKHSNDIATATNVHPSTASTPTAITSAPTTSSPIVPVNSPITPQPTTLALSIPNVITPNADGINDCWVIKGIDNCGPVQVQIFTAQSRRIYTTDNYDNHFCGDDLPDGNYFYVLSIKQQNIVRRGVLVIKRY